jgi:hypothetical protein
MSGDPDDAIREWLADKSWTFLFLLDGLDEVPAQFHVDVRKALRNLLHYHHRFVISCRTADYDQSLGDHVAPYVLQGLAPDQISAHLKHTLGEPGQQLFRQLANDEALLSLASDPLLLEIMETIAQQDPGVRLPRNPGQLLRLFVQTMPLHRERNGFPLGSPPDLVVAALSTIGFQMVSRGAVSATLGEIRHWQVPCGNYNLETLLSVAERWGLLSSDGARGEPVQFIHPIFRDYFAALSVEAGGKPNYEQFLRATRLYDPQWRQTILMLCGISNRPSELIIAMAEELWLIADTRELWNASRLFSSTNVYFLIRCWQSVPINDREVQTAVVDALCHVLRICPLTPIMKEWGGKTFPTFDAWGGETFSAIDALQRIGDDRALPILDWFSERALPSLDSFSEEEIGSLLRDARAAATAIRQKSPLQELRDW